MAESMKSTFQDILDEAKVEEKIGNLLGSVLSVRVHAKLPSNHTVMVGVVDNFYIERGTLVIKFTKEIRFEDYPSKHGDFSGNTIRYHDKKWMLSCHPVHTRNRVESIEVDIEALTKGGP